MVTLYLVLTLLIVGGLIVLAAVRFVRGSSQPSPDLAEEIADEIVWPESPATERPER